MNCSKKYYQIFSLLFLLGCLFQPPSIAWAEKGDDILSPNEGKGHAASAAVENTPCQITIQGNNFLNNDSLLAAAKDELSAYLTEGFSRSDVDDAAFQMEYAYRLAGFVDAIVAYSFEKKNSDSCDVLFDVQEGRRQLIQHISMSGNHAFDGNMLLLLEKNGQYSLGEQRKPLPFVEAEIASLLKKIRYYYLAEGYLDIKLESQKVELPDAVGSFAVNIFIDEGKPYLIGSVSYTGDVLPEFMAEIEAQKNLLVGQKFHQRQRLLLRTSLEELYKNGGYVDAVIRTREKKEEESGTVHLQADILSGKKITINDIILTGLKRTKEDFVFNRLKFRPGETYNLVKIRESFSALYETGLFQSVSIELEEGPELQQRNINVKLEEKPNRELYFEPGWGSYELLRLVVGFRDWNLFGNGHRYRFNTGISSKGRSVEMALTEPWLMGTDIDVDLPIYYRYREEPSFTIENNGFAVYFSKHFSDKIQVTAGYQNDRNNTTRDGDSENSKTIDNYTTTVLTMQLVRDTRDDFFFPSKGYRGFVSADIASSLMGGNLSFYRFKAGARVFRSLGKSSVLGLRYAAGIILPFGDQIEIPEGERFYNGGENSVRSFKESELGKHNNFGQPLGGAAYNVVNLEWRHKLTETIATSIFFDAGNVSPNQSMLLESGQNTSQKALINATLDDFFRDMQVGVGAGIQYLLPVGPARLDLAFNPKADKDMSEASYVLHFSIGMAF